MKKLKLSLMMLFASIIFVNAQSSKSFLLRLGASYNNFQDTKYSTVPYSGGGPVFNLGFEKEGAKSLWETGLNINTSFEIATTNEKDALSVHPNFYFKYLRKVSDNLSIGGNWDILGLYFRNTNGLGNNSKYYLSSSDLMLSTNYKMNKFDFGLDLGLLSWIKEGTGFAFSAPQNVLEEGEFDYQNESADDPFGWKYFQLRGPFSHLLLRTNITYKLSNRFSLGYQWRVRYFDEVEDYPVTMGRHNFTIRWNIFRSSSEATPEI